MFFNELQSRLWKKMIKSILDYRVGKIKYYDLVYELEGALDAGSFKDEILRLQWYDHWTPLEIYSAQKGNSTTLEEAEKYLIPMEYFLRNRLKNSKNPSGFLE